MPLIECVPNVSEGRRPEVIAALADALRSSPGIRLLDVSADPSHHRSVYTFVGEPGPVQAAVLTLYEHALPAIDLRVHRGEHPRIGAVDVVPFIPLDGATLAGCAELARTTAAAVAARFEVPIFLYEAAASTPERQGLERIRRGGFEGLEARMATAAWRPDFGPAKPHPRAGASAFGARLPLIAFNVNLASDRLDLAQAIARTIRASGGGLPCLKAIGVRLAERGIVQVSMNLTDHRRTSMHQAFLAVQVEASRHGVQVLESELIGLVPEEAVAAAAAHFLLLPALDTTRVLESRIRSAQSAVPAPSGA